MSKILLVENDPQHIKLYTKKLAETGCEITVAVNGFEGLVKAIQDTPSIIIVDILMPKVTGEDLLRALKSIKQLKDIPVIILTNITDSDIEERTKELGAVAIK
jgi:CheY-like chemotaxis protein